jgi:cytochrome c
MKMRTALTIFSLFLPIAAPAVAADEEQLAQTSGCLNCHAPAKRIVGPSFKAIASHYKDDPGAESYLINKVKNGGAGVWGQVPMPPNSSQVGDAAIKTLVKWILAQQ